MLLLRLSFQTPTRFDFYGIFPRKHFNGHVYSHAKCVHRIYSTIFLRNLPNIKETEAECEKLITRINGNIISITKNSNSFSE